MSDLDGMDAFTEIVNRLIDAEQRIERLTDAKNTADRDRLAANHEVVAFKQSNGRLTSDLADARSKIEKLEKAAAEVVSAVNGIPVDVKLAVAIKKLDDLVDDIPF